MKARDIVSPWPRPRSVMAFCCWNWHPWRFMSEEHKREWESNREYHKRQQEMVTAYIEDWRNRQWPTITFDVSQN